MAIPLNSTVQIVDGLRSATIDRAFIGAIGIVTHITAPNENYSCEQYTVTLPNGKHDMFFEEELVAA